MATYLQASVWRKKCLSNNPPSGFCPVNYKWDCKRVRVISKRSIDHQIMAEYKAKGYPVFLSLDVYVDPARPFVRKNRTKKGCKRYA